jgi:hypothetical protein
VNYQSLKSKVYVVSRCYDDFSVVVATFVSQEDADRYADSDQDLAVTETDLEEGWDPKYEPYTYWTRWAEVYPDGEVVQHVRTRHSVGPDRIDAVSHDLSTEPSDGHRAGHCGLQVMVVGSDRQQVEQELRRRVAAAKAQSTGRCACGRTGDWQREWPRTEPKSFIRRGKSTCFLVPPA